MILIYLIIWLVGIFAIGWLFRWSGQIVNWPKKEWNIYFRDMPYLVGVGFVFGVSLILFTLYVYFIMQTKFFVWGVQLLVICGLAGVIFRFLGQRIGTENSKKLFRSMPVTAAFGILTVALYAILAIFADFIAPYEQDEIFEVINVLPGGNPELGGDPRFLLGTDQLGRDLLTRLIYGAQNTVGIAFATTVFSFLIGITGGFLAATLGGWVDQVLSRAVDALMAIPQLIFALLLMTIATAWAGSNKVLIMVYMVLIIAVLDSTRVYRLSRAVGLNIVVMDYIEAAKVRGETLRYLLFREILPNSMAPLLAEFGLRFCFVFLTISALSFLGIGIQPPLADWGTMVRDLAQFINFASFSPLTATLPLLAAGAIALLTVAVNFIVDWVLHKSSGLKG